ATRSNVFVRAAPDTKTPDPAADRRRESRMPDDALEAFCLEFDYLCRTLQRLGVPKADIEDLAHEVFLVLSRKWQDYDTTRPLRAYLFGIAFRVAARHRRRQSREVPGEVPDIADTRANADEMLSAAEKRALVLRALEYIALPRRAVLVMHDLDESPKSGRVHS